MKIRFLSAVILSLAASTALSFPAMALDDPGHPRVNQVENRLEHQENNTLNAADHDRLTPGQAMRDEKRDQHIQNQIQRDESKHNGHITKREQRKLNHEMKRDRLEKRRQERRDRHLKHEQHEHHEIMHHDQ